MDDHDWKLTVGADGIVRLEQETDEKVSERCEAKICHDELTRDSVLRLNRFIAHRAGPIEAQDLRLLGRLLYRILFDGAASMVMELKASAKELDRTPTGGSLGEKFLTIYQDFEERCSDVGVGEKAHFRLSLVFEETSAYDETSALATYPWEALYVSRPGGRGFFIAGEDTRLILTRIIPPVFKPRPPTQSLLIWIAWAQPRELGAIQPHGEAATAGTVEAMAKGIQDKLDQSKVTVRVLPNVTRKDLEVALQEGGRPDIVHFIGHGQVIDKVGEVALCKTKEQLDADRGAAALEGRPAQSVPEADWQGGAQLKALFRDQPPWLFFLHACETATTPNVEGLHSVAQQIALANVPCVIAMQYEIATEDAELFSEAFYNALAGGLPIDDAVRAGRTLLGKRYPAWGHRRFATPVVFLRTNNLSLVESRPTAPEMGTGPVASGKEDCPYPDCEWKVSSAQKLCSCKNRRDLKRCENVECRRVNTENTPECVYCRCPFSLPSIDAIRVEAKVPLRPNTLTG